jgi:hypothetical protein
VAKRTAAREPLFAVVRRKRGGWDLVKAANGMPFREAFLLACERAWRAR